MYFSPGVELSKVGITLYTYEATTAADADTACEADTDVNEYELVNAYEADPTTAAKST